MKLKTFIASVACGLFLSACGGPEPKEGGETAEPTLATSESAICEGWNAGARTCTFKCTSSSNWTYLYGVPEGQCTARATGVCGYTPYGTCWSF